MSTYAHPSPQRWWAHAAWAAQVHDDEHSHRGHGRRAHHGRRDRGGRDRGGRGEGFGPGPGFDPRGLGFGGPGSRGPFRGRRAARGDVRASVLALVAEQPMHGYQIITELAERSAGAWRPSPGSVYPVIQQLQDEGLVGIEETDGRRVVHLTEVGRAYVEQHADELTAPWEAVGGQDESTWTLLSAARGLAAAAWQVANAGTAADVEKAAEVLTDARRRLYGILADSGDEPNAADSPPDTPPTTPAE